MTHRQRAHVLVRRPATQAMLEALVQCGHCRRCRCRLTRLCLVTTCSAPVDGMHPQTQECGATVASQCADRLERLRHQKRRVAGTGRCVAGNQYLTEHSRSRRHRLQLRRHIMLRLRLCCGDRPVAVAAHVVSSRRRSGGDAAGSGEKLQPARAGRGEACANAGKHCRHDARLLHRRRRGGGRGLSLCAAGQPLLQHLRTTRPSR
jgi:hypothetical protein